MEMLLCYFIGVIIGIVITSIYYKKVKVYGVIAIDHHAKLCNAKIGNEKFFERNNKYAMFIIDHNAVISQEKHTL